MWLEKPSPHDHQDLCKTSALVTYLPVHVLCDVLSQMGEPYIHCLCAEWSWYIVNAYRFIRFQYLHRNYM